MGTAHGDEPTLSSSSDLHQTVACSSAGSHIPASAQFAFRVGNQDFAIADGDTSIGRDGRSTIVIDSLAISRSHARITVTGDLILLEDLGSKNGTYVNDRRLDNVTEISEGVEIRLGPIWCKLTALRGRR